MPVLTCPVCGAQNDPMNRFCDQCGTRLDQSADQPVSLEVVPPEPSAPVGLNCSNCGASVLFGQAFCDECGFPLSSPYAEPTLTDSDMPTMIAPPMSAPATDANDVTLFAPPSEASATPTAADMAAYAAPTEEMPAVSPGTPEPEPSLPPRPTEVPAASVEPFLPTQTPAKATGPDVPSLPTQTPAEAPATSAEPSPPTQTPAETDEPTSMPAPVPSDSTPVEAIDDLERQRLTSLITAHHETITQYEQMLARYPAGAAPAFLTAGLDEARQAIAQAETELAALDFGPDPAEVARLESLVSAHRETVAQYEQMIGRYPASSAPAFLTAGLDEARRALARAEAELAGLTGTVPPPAYAPAEPATTPASTMQPAPPTPAAPPTTGPRLVLVNSGTELFFPAGKQEITIGREDPVSQIYPEIDLTPYGGEAGGVSRQHARISQQNGQWAITDLDSTNYTRVDGRKIDPHTPTPIQHGSQVQFGRIALVFQV